MENPIQETTDLFRFQITEEQEEERVDKCIAALIDSLSRSFIQKMIKEGRVCINGLPVKASYQVKAGDDLSFLLPKAQEPDIEPEDIPLDILYEDENIMLLDKKAGLLCHPDDREYVDTLITRIKKYLYEKGEYKPDEENSFTPALVNRIDRNTGGIVIAAKNAESLRIMNAQMKQRTNLKKFYLCVCHGIMERDSGLLEGYLL